MPKLNCLNLPQPVFSWTPSFWCPAARTGSRSPPGWACSSRGSRRQPTATEAEETVVSSYSGTLTPSHLAPFLLRKLLITVRQTVFCALSCGIGSQTKSSIVQQKMTRSVKEVIRSKRGWLKQDVFILWKTLTIPRGAKNMLTSLDCNLMRGGIFWEEKHWGKIAQWKRFCDLSRSGILKTEQCGWYSIKSMNLLYVIVISVAIYILQWY